MPVNSCSYCCKFIMVSVVSKSCAVHRPSLTANNERSGLYQATGGGSISGQTLGAKRRPMVPTDRLSAYHVSSAPVTAEKISTGASSAASRNGHDHHRALTSPHRASDFEQTCWRISDEFFCDHETVKALQATVEIFVKSLDPGRCDARGLTSAP